MFRRSFLVVIAVAAVMATPNLAAAATVSTAFNSAVFFSAEAGETNQVVVTASAGSTSGKKLVFQESGPGVTLTAPAQEPFAPDTANGCTATAANTVTCDNLPAGYNAAVTVLGDMADTVTATGSFQALGLRLDGQGGSGADTLNGGDGNDSFNGNHSSDPAQTGIGSDTINGGGGFDTASYFFATGPVTATANGTGGQAGETDILNSIEGLWGSDGYDDILTGDSVPNDFVGFGGNDTINADGGGTDTVRCDGLFVGSPVGTDDTANLDALDVLATDHGCENVNRSGGSADADGDGVLDGDDLCPDTASGAQVATDGCDDPDGDGVSTDAGDNCPAVSNADQADADTDGEGDACETGGGTEPSKDQCKKNGWMDYGTTYKNQGRCVSRA